MEPEDVTSHADVTWQATLTTRRTRARWVHELTAPDAELTILELIALAVIELRDTSMFTRFSNEHVESLLTTLDEMLASTHPVYSALAEKRSRGATPKLASAEV